MVLIKFYDGFLLMTCWFTVSENICLSYGFYIGIAGRYGHRKPNILAGSQCLVTILSHLGEHGSQTTLAHDERKTDKTMIVKVFMFLFNRIN